MVRISAAATTWVDQAAATAAIPVYLVCCTKAFGADAVVVSRSDDERVADILEAAAEVALIVDVGHYAFRSSTIHVCAAETH